MMGQMNNNSNNSNSNNPFQPPAAGNNDQRQAMMQMMQSNPAMFQTMQNSIRQNPGLFRQMISQQDPMAAMLFQNMSDEQVAQVITQMLNPDNMNRMMQMEQQLRGLNLVAGNTANATTTNANNNGNINPMFNPWSSPNNTTTPTLSTAAAQASHPGLDFSTLLQPQSSNLHPVDRFRIQLRSLYDMGFDDEIWNIAALQSVNGNLNRAVDLLLSGDVPVTANDTTTNETTTNTTTAAAGNDNSNNNNNSTENVPEEPPKDAQEKKND
jgi:hypothetical protein